MDIEVNYRNKKRYNILKYPVHQTKFWTNIILLLSKIALIGKKYKIEKIDAEDIKPPYLLLSNHMAFIDFALCAKATYPHPLSNVVTIDGFVYRFALLEWIGSIATRRFTTDIHLCKCIFKVLKRGDVLSMYPEARYTLCGVPSYMPESLGKLIKKCKVPVVTILHRGNHLSAPFWNWRNKRKVPFHTTYSLLLTREQIASMSVEEINQKLHEALDYDDYRYQKENGIKITESYRAEGLHRVLYQCPHCKEEFKMDSKGAEIFCTACNKRWTWREGGYLEANNGVTEFDHIPDWFNWEREQVREQIENGTYSFSDEVEVFSLPRVYRYIPLGKAKLTHTIEEGFKLQGEYRGARYYIHRKPIQTNSLHIEYEYWPLKGRDCLDISTVNDSFYCSPSQPNVVTKISFATEILYEKAVEKTKQKD